MPNWNQIQHLVLLNGMPKSRFNEACRAYF